MLRTCRDCASRSQAEICPACGSGRSIAHPSLDSLAIAHLDCDAFYAAVEKRDDPRLAPLPVIIGGGKRGVVSTACYVARAFGVRSAMPMFKALALCPNAVVIKPNMAKYVAVGRQIRERMQALTPLVEPLSIDEAFLDLSGTEALHQGPPAQTLIRLQSEIEADLGLTVSIGLSYNKFLAKLASDLEKPRGFSIIAREDALSILAPLPPARLPGVGPAAVKIMDACGWTTIAALRTAGEPALRARFGDWGTRLYELAHGRDFRRVDPDSDRKTMSAETTFHSDLRDLGALEDELWELCETVSARARAAGLAGRTVTLKLKTNSFKLITRRRALPEPTVLAHRLMDAGRTLLRAEATGREAYRLIGIGLSDFSDSDSADKGDLLDQRTPKIAAAETAVAKARARFGRNAVMTGRSLKGKQE